MAVGGGETRRGFLLACASALTGGCAPAPPISARVAGTAHEPSVVVVGAGLSGLAVAHSLTELGFDVRVLEATQRVGGRILTIRSPFVEGQYVEAGATHVVNDPALLELCAALGIQLEQWAPQRGLARVTLLGTDRSTSPGNVRRPSRDPLSAEEEQLGDQGRMHNYFAEAETFDPTAPLPKSLFHLDELSGAAFLRQRGASPGFVASMDSMLGVGDDGIEGMSALAMVQEWAESASKCWSSDPFQQGAYAYFKVGQAASFGPALARAEGRLHFAGNHASHRPGFMHGALAAAQRVVGEIAAATSAEALIQRRRWNVRLPR